MIYLQLAFALWLYMSIWFLMSLITKRSDVADIAWGLGFVLISLLAWNFAGRPLDLFSLLPLFCVSIWGIRLATHIFVRNKGKTEDKRYNAWRKEWGKTFLLRSYLQIFMLQGALLAIIVSPLVFLFVEGRDASTVSSFLLGFMSTHASGMAGGLLGGVFLGGFLLWMTGFIFEAVGDAQLATFLSRSENKGRIIESGLWKYTRHPNYFGESLLWWGMWIMCFSAGGMGWFALIVSPALITYLLLFVSGVPMLEEHYKNNAAYQEYASRTSKFFPWFPKAKK